MKNVKQLTAFGLAAALTGISGAASAATVNGTAAANILAPLGITQSAAMNFGGISGDPLIATSAVLDTADGVVASAGAWSDGIAVASGAFNVTGGAGAIYTITLPASATVTEGGGATMTVNAFTSSAATGTIGGADFTVGATLNVGAAQVQGGYNGIYVMTVNYQ